jgi:hypothetical protein
MFPDAPDPRNDAPRTVVGAIIGAEAGAGIGLLWFGATPLAPLALALAGALAGPPLAAGITIVARGVVRRRLRSQIRRAHPPPSA